MSLRWYLWLPGCVHLELSRATCHLGRRRRESHKPERDAVDGPDRVDVSSRRCSTITYNTAHTNSVRNTPSSQERPSVPAPFIILTYTIHMHKA